METFAQSICCSVPLEKCDCESKVKIKTKPTIKDFRFIERIGKGGFGNVHLVMRVNDPDDKCFALKIVDKNAIKNNFKGIQHALTEMQIMAQLDHPFIVKVHDIFDSSRRICYLMEFLQGGELYTWLVRKVSFEEHSAKHYLAQISLALAYLHDEGILYRDLKPENIMLDHKGNAKLVDFGLSQAHMDSRMTRTMCGTVAYMPPEVILKKWYTYPADCWSFGILVYDMLIGIPPFNSDNVEECQKAILRGKITFPYEPQISNPAKQLIRDLLKRDPSERLKCKDVSKHPFFDTINFDSIYDKTAHPPISPHITSSTDLSHFSSEFFSSYRNEEFSDSSEFESFEDAAPTNGSETLRERSGELENATLANSNN